MDSQLRRKDSPNTENVFKEIKLQMFKQEKKTAE